LESNAAAVRDLGRNLARASLDNVEILSDRVEVALRSRGFGAQRPDAIVIDPPRTGLPPGSCEALVELAPDRIVYLACDPATQARDVGYLVADGYALDHVAAFDLFPQTPHVESLAVLVRSEIGARDLGV
jgi:tRNA/tmRNA/rRNA uracil-C5-methylase (TrmA/RlmC/RlmD family)